MNLRAFTKEKYNTYEAMAQKLYSSGATLSTPDGNVFRRNFTAILAKDYVYGWFIEDADHYVGYCLASAMYSTEVGGTQLWIEELYLDSTFQGQGLGSQTLQQLLEMFPDVIRFRLEVASENVAARRLYERLGYRNLDYQQMILDR